MWEAANPWWIHLVFYSWPVFSLLPRVKTMKSKGGGKTTTPARKYLCVGILFFLQPFLSRFLVSKGKTKGKKGWRKTSIANRGIFLYSLAHRSRSVGTSGNETVVTWISCFLLPLPKIGKWKQEIWTGYGRPFSTVCLKDGWKKENTRNFQRHKRK